MVCYSTLFAYQQSIEIKIGLKNCNNSHRNIDFIKLWNTDFSFAPYQGHQM